MQTFLPYADFRTSAKCLDYKRLGKQRVEAKQIHNIVANDRTTGGWVNHPAVKMWRGYAEALAWYYNIICLEWLDRGYEHNMQPLRVYGVPLKDTVMPPFIGNEDFHDSHKSNLLRKNPDYYGQYQWKVPNNLSYIWEV